MTIEKIIKSAIQIADTLDRLGYEELTTKIDEEIITPLSQHPNRKLAQQEFEMEIPEEERLMLEDVLLSLQDSLKAE